MQIGFSKAWLDDFRGLEVVHRVGKDHLIALDGARGVAAMAVMLYHVDAVVNGAARLGGSFLAVDFFFLLSGFVVARSYEDRLRSGAMTLPRFVWTRVVRLYPLYLVACAVGFAYFAAKLVMGEPDAPTRADLALALPGTLALVPQPGAVSWGFTEFPFAPSAWSLSFELWFTIVYAAVVPRLPSHVLVGIIGLAFAILAHQARVLGTIDMGYDQRTFLGGAARFWFSFTLGVVIHRERHRLLPRQPLPLLLGVPAFAFVLLPREAVGAGLVWIALIFPAALVAGTAMECRGRTAALLDHLGRLSYAIYILHAPVILFTFGAAKKVLGDPWNAWPGPLMAAATLIVLAASAAATYLFDEPFRARLREIRIFRPRSAG